MELFNKILWKFHIAKLWGRDLYLTFFFPHFIFCQMANQLPQYYLLNNPFFPHHFVIDLLYILDWRISVYPIFHSKWKKSDSKSVGILGNKNKFFILTNKICNLWSYIKAQSVELYKSSEVYFFKVFFFFLCGPFLKSLLNCYNSASAVYILVFWRRDL